MSRLAGKDARPAGGRLNLSPHVIVLLLVASLLVPSGFGAGTLIPDQDTHPATAECVVLEDFLKSPDLLANFEGTPAEMQRWVDAYDNHCD